MKISDLLVFIIFFAVIIYRFYVRKKNKGTKEKEKDNNEEKAILTVDGAVHSPVIHRVYVQPVDFEKTDDSKTVAVSLELAIDEYLDSIDRMGAVRPSNVRFFTNYNRIFIIYMWS